VDACDQCGARAYVHVEIDTGLPLSFCAHHYRANEEALYAYAKKVVDLRHQLQPN
jgi:hypothetical protein